MLKYVEEVKAHVPGWQSGGAGGGKGKGGVMSQRVSSFQHEEGGDGGPRQQVRGEPVSVH